MPLNEQGIFEYDSGFLKNQESAEAYSGTPEDIEDQQLESSEEAQAVRSETALNEQDHFGNIPLLSSMARTTAIGFTDLINETDKFFGVSNAIQKRYDIQLGENTLLYTPEEMGLRPRHLFESFGSTIIPFAVPFLGVAKIPGTLQLASKLTTSLGLLKNSKYSKGALDGILGSIPVDAVVWNPDDPNWINQVTSGIAVNDTGVMATLRDWLATNPDDPDAWNRGRNAFVNIWAGVVGEGFFALLRGTGSFAKSVVSAPKELKTISKENAEIIAKAVEKAKKEKPQEVQELLEKLPKDTRRAEDFLEPETAGEALAKAKNPANEYHQTPSPKRDIKSPLYKVTAEEEKAIIKLAEDALDRPLAGGKGVKVGKNIDIDDPKFPVNMWKLDGPEQIRALIHGIGRVLEPKLAKSIKMEDLTKGASDLTGVNASKIMEVAKTTEYARGFVLASRLVQMKAADDYLKALDEYLLNPADVEKQFNMNMAKLQAAEAVHAGADFSTAAGRLLNEFKQVADNATVAEQAELWRMDVMNNIIDSGKVTLKKAQRARKLTAEQASKAKATRAGDVDPQVSRAKRKKAPKTDERAEDIKNVAKKTRERLKKSRRATPSELQGLLAASHQSLFARTRNAVLENYINGLLSNPKTQLVNIAGNTSAILTSIFERAYAGFKNEGIEGVQGREVYHLLIGMNEARKDALSTFMKAFREGPSDFSIKNDFSKPYQRAISKENFGASGNLGRVIDWVGDKVNIPGRLLMSADEVFKAVNYRGEVRALAHRKAYSDVAEQLGRHPSNDIERSLVVEKYAKMFETNNMPQEILDGAKDFARKNTFTNDLGTTTIIGRNGKPQQVAGFSANIRNAIEADPTGIGKVLVPFFQTPVNLIKFGAERTPILRWLTPLKNELADTAPVAVRQIAEAKVATGNFIASTGIMMGLGGLVTGASPKDPQLKQRYEAAGVLPYHIWTPAGYRPYDRFDPLGMTLAAAGNLGILARALIDITGHVGSDGLQPRLLDAYETAFSQFGLGTARLLSDRHYFQTFGLVADIMQGDSRAWSSFGRNISADKLLLPYSSLRKALIKGVDPVRPAYIREESQFEEGDTLTEFVGKGFSQAWDTWLTESTHLIPGWGQPPMLNEIGEPTHYPGSEFNDDLHFAPARILRGMLNETLNLAAETPRSKSPLLNKLAELDMGQQTPKDLKSIEGVTLSSEEHQYYSEQVGDYNKTLESEVRSKAFNKLPEGEQRFKLEFKLKNNKARASSDVKRKFDRIRQTSLFNRRSKRKERQQDIAGNNLGGLFNNKGQQ